MTSLNSEHIWDFEMNNPIRVSKIAENLKQNSKKGEKSSNKI